MGRAMTRRMTVPQPEVLISHAGFIRSVAQKLLLDDHAVDDVVQQTLLAALEKPPRRDGPLRPWLATVARNLARMRRRTDGRAARREERAARPEAMAATSEIAERLDMQRRLVEAVSSLDEPYRDVVVLRFFDELPPREIAARLDIPVETVRTRTRRALEQLRERLDRRPGGRDAWRLALLPLALPPLRTEVAIGAAVGSTTAAIVGVIGMKSIVAIAGSLLAAALILWNQMDGSVADDSVRAEMTASKRTSNDPEAGALGAGVSGSAEAGKAQAEKAPRDFTFRGEVVDVAGEPVRGAKISGAVRGTQGRIVEFTSGADGEFELGGVAGDRTLALRVAQDGFVPMSAYLPAWQEVATRIVLRRGSELRLQVVSPSGAPVAGAKFESTASQSEPASDSLNWAYWSDNQTGSSDKGGTIALGRLPRCEIKIKIEHPDFAAYEHEFGAEETATGLIRIKLRIGGTVLGRVLGPDGEPIAGAVVTADACTAKSNAAGAFQLQHVSPNGVQISASHPRFAPATFGSAIGWRKKVPVSVDEGETIEGIDLHLAPATRVIGRVVDVNGEAVEGFEIQSFCPGAYSAGKFAFTGPDGRFVAGPWNLEKKGTWDLQRSKSGNYRLAKGRKLPIEPGQTLDVGDLVVQSRPIIRGRVVTADGNAVTPRMVTDVKFTLQRRFGPRVWDDFGSSEVLLPVQNDGTFELRLDPAIYSVRATSGVDLQTDSLVVDTSKPADGEIVLVLHRTISVSGEVRRANGDPGQFRAIAIVPSDTPATWQAGKDIQTSTNRDGQFRFRLTKPGNYRIGIRWTGPNNTRGFATDPKPIEVVVGTEPIEGLSLRVVPQETGVMVRGVVVAAVNGKPIKQASLSFYRYRFFVANLHTMTSSWDRAGAFQHRITDPGTYSCKVSASGYSSVMTAKFEVKGSGAVDLGTVRLPPLLKLTGAVLDTQGRPVPYAQVHLLSATGQQRDTVYTDTKGVFRMDDADAGVFNVFAVSPRHAVAVMKAVRVKKGAVNRIEIRLPEASPLTVHVRDENGQPVVGAKLVYAFPSVAPFTSAEFGRYEPPSFGQNKSDANGDIIKPFMPATTLTLRIAKKGFVTLQKTVRTEKRKPTEIEVTLVRRP